MSSRSSSGQRFVAGRNAVIGGALEDVELPRLLGDDRDRLDAGRSGADHGYALTGEVDGFLGPVRGVVDLAGEGRQAPEVGCHRIGQRTGRHQREPRREYPPVVGGDGPPRPRLVEHRRDDAGVERDVAAQVELVGDPIQIAQDLGLGGVLLRPVPLLLELLGKRVAVVDALDVTACPRIPVVVPGAADFGSGLEHPHREPLTAQLVQGIQPGEPRAHDHRVQSSQPSQAPTVRTPGPANPAPSR